MLKISCLQTVDSNIAVFEAARRQLRFDDVILKHRVRSDFLAMAEAAGSATPDILARTAAELRLVAAGANAVLLTCSTLGTATAGLTDELDLPMLRIDEALAHETVAGGGMIVVLCAAPTTIAPTRRLFEAAAMATGASIELRLVPGAWEAFRAGDQDRYLRLIAEDAELAAREGATVALAQASMAAAVRLMGAGPPPRTGPAAGLRAALAMAQAAASNASKQS